MDWNKYYPYFQPWEFECKCGCGLNIMTKRHMDMLLAARLDAGIAFNINSGCRCEAHNEWVGGADESDHLTGDGSDIRCNSSSDRFRIKGAFYRAGFRRIGNEGRFIHAGTREDLPQNVEWIY